MFKLNAKETIGACDSAYGRLFFARLAGYGRIGHGVGEFFGGFGPFAQSSLGLHVDAHVDESHDEQRHKKRTGRRVESVEFISGYVALYFHEAGCGRRRVGRLYAAHCFGVPNHNRQ